MIFIWIYIKMYPPAIWVAACGSWKWWSHGHGPIFVWWTVVILVWWFTYEHCAQTELEWKWDNLGLYDFPYGYVELASDDESQTSESRWLSDLTWQFLVSISVIRDINGRFRDFTKRGAPLVCRLSACWGMRAEDGTSTITEGLYVRRNWPDNIWLVVRNIFYFP